MGQGKMIVRIFSLLFILFLSAAVSYGDLNVQTQNIRSFGEINDIAVNGDFVWCASTNGIIRWNIIDTTYTCYTVSDGLPSSNVTVIAVAGDGAVYAGTDSGLVRYDDSSWTIIRMDDSQPENIISAINFDHEGVLWIATPTALLYYKDNEWHTIESAVNGTITSIAFAPDNSVWYSLDGHYRGKVGVVGLTDDGPITYIRNEGLLDYHINSIRFDEDGVLWASGKTGLYRFDGEDWTSDDRLGNLLETLRDHEGNLWCASLMNLLVFNLDNESWISNPSGVNAWLTSIAIGDDGMIWAGTHRDGLYLFDGESWSVLRTDNGPLGNTIHDITVTPEGDVWVTSGFLGVSSLKQGKWSYYTEQNGLPSRFTSCVEIDSDNNIWLGSAYELSVYDGISWEIPVWEDGTPIDSIKAVTACPDGTVWVGSNRGAFSYDGESWTAFTTVDGLIDNNIVVLETGPDGTVWAAGSHHERYGDILRKWFGICRFNNGVWVAYKTESPTFTSVNALAPCDDGSVWVGTTKGLYLFDGVNWKKFSSEDVLEFSNIVSLAMDQDSVLWIGSGSTVCTYDGSSFTTVADLGDFRNEITSIALDAQNTAWVGTRNGLYRISILSTDVATQANYPATITIHGNYPNPFNQGTAINYRIAQTGLVNLVIYDLLGRKVATLVDEVRTPGNYTVKWNAQDHASGVYLCRVKLGASKMLTRKMLLLR